MHNHSLTLEPCPICDNTGKIVKHLSKLFILKSLSDYYAQNISLDLDISDYYLLRCEKCELEYSQPMRPGSWAFYEWITKQPRYYPSERWEWGTALDRISAHGSAKRKVDILEVGCGTGCFLELAKGVTLGKVVGLEPTLTSANHCRDKGLDVYCEGIESFQSRVVDQEYLFDFVVAFHCLEHVHHPKEFVCSMKKLLNPGGRLYLSTPYSPMCFEGSWFDPLNHPPHHLTRWNYRAYKELASQLDLQIDYFMPEAANIADRTIYSMNLRLYGPSKPASRKHMYLYAMTHPLVTLREYTHQTRRERLGSMVAADGILVELLRTE